MATNELRLLVRRCAALFGHLRIANFGKTSSVEDNQLCATVRSSPVAGFSFYASYKASKYRRAVMAAKQFRQLGSRTGPPDSCFW